MKSPRAVSQSFIDRADGAAFWEAWVGAVLSRAGLYTLHHPFEIDGLDHGKTWDLEVAKSPGPVGLLDPFQVEVKSVNLEFTCPQDYPFYNVLVCSQNSWMRKWPGASRTKRDFLLVSRKTGCVVWIPTGSHVLLEQKVHDASRNETYMAATAFQTDLKPLGDFVEYIKA